MATGQYHKFYLIFFTLAFCALRISAQSNNQTCATIYATNFTAPAGLSTLKINYPSEISSYVQFDFYPTTTGDVDVDIEWCSDDASLISTLRGLTANLTSQIDSVLLSLGLGEVGGESTTSAATRAQLVFPLTLLTVVASLFFLSNSRATGIFVLCAICVALCVPTYAASTTVVIIRVGLPTQVTQICENGVCSAWPPASPTPLPTEAPTEAPTTSSPTTSSPGGGSSTTGGSAATTGSPTTSAATTSAPTTSAPTTSTPTTSAPTTSSPTSAPSSAPTSAPSSAPTSAPTPAPSSAPTSAPTSAPSSAPTSAPSSAPTSAPPTDAPTSTPTSAPTDAPTSAPTIAPTGPPPTVGPATLFFQLKVLILCKNKASQLGADFATLAFDMVGMPYDFVTVNATVDLSTYLSTSGTGAYSGIVIVYTTAGANFLSADQNTMVSAYQQKYGVKLVIVNSLDATATLPGVTISSTKTTTEYYQVSLASEFSQYGQFLNQSASVDTTDTILWSAYQNTPCTLLHVTITDSTLVTPVLYAYPSIGQTVAAAVIKMTDGTEQLHYFMNEGADYIHSMAFASVMVNWISPGGLFIGMRRLIFTVQPDDLFLGSYVWNTTTHSNPVDANAFFYRITADDLQNLADFFDFINPKLPEGSYVTVEWPTNFGGVNNSYYLKGAPVDDLYNKAREILDKFYYLSHTWDHPCVGAPEDFDSSTPSEAYTLGMMELGNNIDYMPYFFGDQQHLWSNHSMITPCVTGLYNSGLLQAMNDNGITSCVSDESVAKTDIDYEPLVPYAGQYSTIARNGYEGVFFVPRQALDIDYCARTPADCLDEWKTTRDKDDPVFDTFEEYLVMERMLAIQYLVAFRWDPYMMHQTNAMAFTYDDPNPEYFGLGSSYSTSLVALWMQKVLGDILLYYNLPIVTKQMDDLTSMFIQRQTMDGCGISAVLGVNAQNEIVDLSLSSASACTMTLSGGAVLSGSTVSMETVGVETTAYIDLSGSGTQQFTFASPISM